MVRVKMFIAELELRHCRFQIKFVSDSSTMGAAPEITTLPINTINAIVICDSSIFPNSKNYKTNIIVHGLVVQW